ncbi:MAG: PAS domain S-box protein [Agriterribacter sp.]
MNLSAGKILLFTLLLTVIAVAVSVYVSITQSNKINESFLLIGHTQDILYHSEKLLLATTESRAIAKEYALSGDDEHLFSIKQVKSAIEDTYQQLRNYTTDNPNQQRRVDSLYLLISRGVELTDSVIAVRRNAGREPALDLINNEQVKLNTAGINRLIENIEKEEQQILHQRQFVNTEAIATFKSILYVVFGLLVILVIMLLQKLKLDLVADKTTDTVVKYNALLMEHIQDAVISTDKNFTVVSWNKKAEAIFGWTFEEIRGKTLAATLKPLYKGSTRSAVVKKFLQNGSWEGEAVLHRKDGSPVTLLLSSAMMGRDSDKMTGTVIIAKDISARKELEDQLKKFNKELGKQVEDRTSEIKNIVERLVRSEKKYKLLFENNPLPMWMITIPELNITDVNDAAVQQYGYSRRLFLQMNVRDLQPPEDIDAFEQYMKELEEGYHNAGVWKHRKKDGTIIFAEMFAYDMELNNRHVRLVLANDVTEKINAEQQLRQSLEEIRMLSGHLQEVREEERKNIAREIHDELGQQLTVLKMDVAWSVRKLKDPASEVTKRLKELMEMIDTTIKTVRRICSELRPTVLDDLGLTAAMEWHARTFENSTGIQVKLNLPANGLNCSPEIKTGLFRIYQESLTNIARHAEATATEVNLRIEDGCIVLHIKDDGKGFDIDAASQRKTLGILGMKERSLMMGGRYVVESRPGSGTSTTVIIPLEQNIIEKHSGSIEEL